MNTEMLVFIIEIIGTVAFASSGAMVGIRKKMDIFGVIVMAVMTAVGGGIIRDLVVNHWGKKTNCNIQVDGTLKDAAKKVFRGSIDFKRGSSGSKGAETENVLLLGDDVENKTIPLILCAEEDVDGSHGATIGELDEETLFYFAARGIDQETAEDIMTKAKLEVLYQHIQDEETERIVADQLTKVMSNDSQ